MSIVFLSFQYCAKTPARLDQFLQTELVSYLQKTNPSLETSNSKIRRLIIAGAISIDGKQIRVPSFMVKKPMKIIAALDIEKFFYEKQPDDVSFEVTKNAILFEDDYIIIVNKPSNFPTEQTIVESRDHLHAAVKRYLATQIQQKNTPYAGLLHRLDRETSGVILFSKKREVNAAIHAQFIDHSIRKEYVALCSGLPTPEKNFSVKNSIGRISNKSSQGKWGEVLVGGEEAHTDFFILGEKKPVTYIQANPITGRTHQIRVHLAGLKLPILGDSLYGGALKIEEIPIPRVMLHARTLHFIHPISKQPQVVEAPLPEDFLQAKKAFGF